MPEPTLTPFNHTNTNGGYSDLELTELNERFWGKVLARCEDVAPNSQTWKELQKRVRVEYDLDFV